MVGKKPSLSSFKKAEIEELFKKARTILKKYGLEVRLTPQANILGRILIVIPRRIGKAVVRNKLRRRIKNIYRQEKLASLGRDAILLIQDPTATELPFETLKQILLTAYDQSTNNPSN